MTSPKISCRTKPNMGGVLPVTSLADATTYTMLLLLSALMNNGPWNARPSGPLGLVIEWAYVYQRRFISMPLD